ncbi:hypothetical protein, partial [Escherichia coli]|uniref:hypothetical protein n=1 Tax=Escherichia coli TaxID=562 RepID=UPI0020758507
MCDSEAEKILFILNKHERAYRCQYPVYIFLAIVLWILPILLIIYLHFCIGIGFCIAWTAYYFLSLFEYFVKYFFPLDREDLLNLMDLAKDSPDAKQGKRLVRTVLIFTESSDQLSRATDRV